MPAPKQKEKYIQWIHNLSLSHKGQVPWNKGKSLSLESRQRMSESHRGSRNHNFGKHFSQEHRGKISESVKKHYSNPANHPNYGKHLKLKTRAKISKARLKEYREGKRETSFLNPEVQKKALANRRTENKHKKGAIAESEWLKTQNEDRVFKSRELPDFMVIGDDGSICFYEIKFNKAHLKSGQRSTFRRLMRHGIPVKVLRLRNGVSQEMVV